MDNNKTSIELCLLGCIRKELYIFLMKETQVAGWSRETLLIGNIIFDLTPAQFNSEIYIWYGADREKVCFQEP